MLPDEMIHISNSESVLLYSRIATGRHKRADLPGDLLHYISDIKDKGLFSEMTQIFWETT